MSINLTVEDRLRVVTAYPTTVKATANLVDQPRHAPGFEQPGYFGEVGR